MQQCSRLLLPAAGAILAFAAMSAQAFPGQDKVQPELLARMHGGEAGSEAKAKGRPDATHRVIVSLDRGRFDNPRALRQALNNASERAALRAHVRAAQESAINSLPRQARDNVLARYKVVPGFSGEFTDKHIERLARHPRVTYVEEMPEHRVMYQEAHPLTGTDSVHAGGHTGQDTVVAIIDDGIDHDHSAFGGQSAFPNDKIIGGYDFADYDSDPTIDCTDQSHGTATTGVAIGNGGGVTGSAPDGKAVVLKVQAASECGQPSLSGDIVASIDWVVDNQSTYDIDIISMSLGGGAFGSQCDSSSTSYRNAIDSAYAAGLVILAASGNEGLCDQISRPACFSNVISVGAIYDADVGSPGYCVSSNSCIGESHSGCSTGAACFDNSTSSDSVTCYSNSASFLDILSPSNCATTAQAGGGTNDCFGGTSSATPYAAGVSASLIEAAGGSGSLNNDDMRSLLADNGVAVNDPKNGLTKPRVDALASLNAIGDGGGGGGGATELTNGVPETGLSGASGEELDFYMDVPSDASNLSFDMSGGSGDADLYVKFGSEPTTSDYDCRPYLSGNNESCDFASPQTGTYYVMVRGYNSFSGVDLVGSFDTGSGGGGAPCSNCDHYSGSLSGSGDSDVQPDGTYYYSGAGTHDGWLEGPSSADFDLELYRWNGSSWSRVERSISSTSSESISYDGSSGYYYWKILSYSGSGGYDFWLDRP